MDPALIELFKQYGVGRRKLTDELFINDKPPARLGVYDLDEENLCHEVTTVPCSVPGCQHIASSLIDAERHYASHRHSCSQCGATLPSPHLLHLHLQEMHDSFFSVLAERKASYGCYIEECKELFWNADERFEHCVEVHKLPKDFRFDQKSKKQKNRKPKKQKDNTTMDLDPAPSNRQQAFTFSNSKHRAFAKYTGKKFTQSNVEKTPTDVNMDGIVEDLKASLPE